MNSGPALTQFVRAGPLLFNYRTAVAVGASNCEVQLGQRVAAMGMVDKQ
jgi:hypothetical protein